MSSEYRNIGNLACEPRVRECKGDIVSISAYRARCLETARDLPKSPAEETLDDFAGKPLAQTRGDRLYALACLAVTCFLFVLFTMPSIP